MIADLDRTLKEMLITKAQDKDLDIRFEAPDDQFAPNLPAVNLFLYDVRENVDLRSNEWQANRDLRGNITQTPPPVRVDCAYLITAWAGDVESEHRLLSEIMRILLQHPSIPKELLQGDLANQSLPLPTVTLQSGHLQSMGEFWQALGGRPKAALHYTVTVSLDVFEPEEIETVPAVRETVIAIRPEL